MIRGNRASLTIHTETMTVGEISAMLGLEPTSSGDKGDLTSAGRAGRDLAPERLRYQQTYWSLMVEVDASDDDETGFSALRALLGELESNLRQVAALRDGGDVWIQWSGDSDSVQGGFVLQADLIRSLAVLGCHVYGTAYFDDEVDEVS